MIAYSCRFIRTSAGHKKNCFCKQQADKSRKQCIVNFLTGKDVHQGKEWDGNLLNHQTQENELPKNMIITAAEQNKKRTRQHRIGSQRRGGDGTKNRFFLIKDDCLKNLFVL